MSHFSQYHQTQTSAENSVKSGLKKLIGKKSEIPSQKALDREEEERRKVLENDSLLTLTGGVDTSIWTRQEIGARRSRMNAFQQARGNNIGKMNQLSLKSNSLQATIARLLEIGINYTDAVERKNAEQEAVTWAPDEAAPHCMNCGLKFGLESTMILSGRHHCRLCGACICRDCCQALFYHGLAEIISFSKKFDQNQTIRTCEYCVVEVMKLKEQSDQGETSRLVSTLYGRFHRIRCNILKLINELGLRSREPLAAKQIADVMENEMKKLDRLSKQIANVDEVDPRLGVQIRKLAQLMLQDAKFAIIKHRSAQSDSSSSSSRNSPSAPSTPIRTMTPPPSTIQRPSPVKSALSSSLSNNIVQTPSVKSAFKIQPTSYQLPDEDSLIRKSDANSNRLSSNLTRSKTSSECSSSRTNERLNQPSNPFGDFDDQDSSVPANPFGSPGNPFGDDESDEEEPIDSEKNVQIKFMRKEIKKLTNRGDHEKAEMVRQVLDEMINS